MNSLYLSHRSSIAGITLCSRTASALAFLLPIAAGAQFVPIPLTAESYNCDVVVERTAPRPIRPTTTASVETGLTNTGFGWFERGYNADWPATGLPAAGTTVHGAFTMDHEYQFAPDYHANNAVLIDSTITHAELVPVAPASFAALCFLLTGAHQGSSATLNYSVHHADGSLETGSILCPDWLDSAPFFAYTPNGRVNVVTFTFGNLNANLPKLFAADITLTNQLSPVSSVEVSYVSGSGHSMIMALSGAAEAGGVFAPIPFTGYNVDAVVEATALRPQLLTGVTTASMSSGALNTLWTWYESGYVADAPQTGVPFAGSTLTNAGAPRQVFQLPPDYSQNNAALLDADSPVLNLTPSVPVACGVLSFLTTAVEGPATNTVVAQHADGSSQTNSLVSPDWMDSGTPAVFAAGGRVNLNNRLVDSLGGPAPRLFAVDLVLSNSISALTNVLLRCPATKPVRTCFFGLSGAGALSPATLSIQQQTGGSIRIWSTSPGRLEWASILEGANTEWRQVGPIAESLVVEPQPGARFYRVISP